MKGLQVSILALTLMALTAAAQSGPRDLKVAASVTVSAISTEAKVSVLFLNTSDHPLSFPRPVLSCQKVPGAMLVVSKFKPSNPNSEQLKLGMGCAACKGISTSEPNIVEQAKDWFALGPGDSVEVEEQLSKDMIIGDVGIYRVQLIYSAPSFNPHDRDELREAGIFLPSSGDYNSNTVTFAIKPPQFDAQ
jgi:hypothetical protein